MSNKQLPISTGLLHACCTDLLTDAHASATCLAQPPGTGPAEFFVQNQYKNCQSSVASSLMLRTPCELMPCVGVELKLSWARTSFKERAVAVAQSQVRMASPAARAWCVKLKVGHLASHGGHVTSKRTFKQLTISARLPQARHTELHTDTHRPPGMAQCGCAGAGHIAAAEKVQDAHTMLGGGGGDWKTAQKCVRKSSVPTFCRSLHLTTITQPNVASVSGAQAQCGRWRQ